MKEEEAGTEVIQYWMEKAHEVLQSARFEQLAGRFVFANHDTTVLDQTLMRWDQVWFVEKDEENSTRLYPLSDYKPRKGEALQKGYLYGRYGVLPFAGELRF